MSKSVSGQRGSRLMPGSVAVQTVLLLCASVEAYDRHTGQKLFENVRLPEGSKVLRGGGYLHVLLGPRIPPWRIARYRLYPL